MEFSVNGFQELEGFISMGQVFTADMREETVSPLLSQQH